MEFAKSIGTRNRYTINMYHARSSLLTRYLLPKSNISLYNWRGQHNLVQQKRGIGTRNGPDGRGHFIHASTLKLALLGTTIGAGSGTAYTIYNTWRDKNSHKENERIPPARLNEFPENVRITKRYLNPNDKSGLDIILFQFQTCPFCCKVRAYLDYMGISYSVVEVDAVLRQDIKWSKQKKVPMVLIREKPLSSMADESLEVNDQYLQMYDSSAIISLLATYMHEKQYSKKLKKNLIDLAEYYPTISFFDDDDKKKYDILNKYFLMFGEGGAPKHLTKDKEE